MTTKKKPNVRLYKECMVDYILNGGKEVTENTFCCPSVFEYYQITRNIAVNLAESLIKMIDNNYSPAISEDSDYKKLAKKNYKTFIETANKILHKKIESIKKGEVKPAKKRVPLNEAIFKHVSTNAINLALFKESVRNSRTLHESSTFEFKLLEKEYKKLVRQLVDMIHEARFEITPEEMKRLRKEKTAK